MHRGRARANRASARVNASQTTAARSQPLADGQAPGWASAWGEDDHGPFVDFTIDAVTQRLRWIPPGRFWMGAPDDEPGRWSAEGPVHEVVIGQGYWLFDTPCTQALWEAVMGDNPSHFKGQDRPVEQVEWHQARAFAEALQQRLAEQAAGEHDDGGRIVLPSEAQWEYACRAGGQSPWYFGDDEAGLGEHAWLLGNAGGETHPVGQKRPNRWGLYDMLGNVWEWTGDHWHDSYVGAPSDGSPWDDDPGAARVIRGGGWDDPAQYCRCAVRYGDHPDNRVLDLGFRCARVHA